ncbi:hypothetical protein KUTeg_004832 [Tegillarca granosa]|uniref:Uncharacterized protein n=1 Tax=Tegillarca granosa TaxID=220873 RepID=A0ABQ9FI06_TEGGR|nr:hypothetical protein KUTeg_004832 [Tegillarca granosa]
MSKPNNARFASIRLCHGMVQKKCKWAGQNCNNSFFSTSVTDHGLCFTFNGPQNKAALTANASDFPLKRGDFLQSGYNHKYVFINKRVLPTYSTTRPKNLGAKSGLKLILNIEQYEYMPGPHEAAGVKILLHEPGEFPFISELGKALQTGTHTFLHHLRKPRGSCGEVQLKFFDNFIH